MSDDAPHFPNLLTTKEVCVALGIDTKTLRWHVREGHLPYLVFGSGEMRPRRRYHPDDLAAFIKARTMRGEPPIAKPRRGQRVWVREPQYLGFTEQLRRLNEERIAQGKVGSKSQR